VLGVLGLVGLGALVVLEPLLGLELEEPELMPPELEEPELMPPLAPLEVEPLAPPCSFF